MSESQLSIRPVEQEDREWVARIFDEYWGATHMVTRGRAHYGHLLPGFIAERPIPPPDDTPDDATQDDAKDDDATEDNPPVQLEKVGLLTYTLDGKSCEIISINSLDENQGIGSALVETMREASKEAGIQRLWVIITNDNLEALRFWQKREFNLVAVYADSIKEARRLKPQIPLTGKHGISIRDEIELEMLL